MGIDMFWRQPQVAVRLTAVFDTSVLTSFLSIEIYDECFVLNSPAGQVCQEGLVDLALLQNVGHNIHHRALPSLPSPLSLHALPSVHSVRKSSTSWRKFFLLIQHSNETDGRSSERIVYLECVNVEIRGCSWKKQRSFSYLDLLVQEKNNQ